MSTFVYLIRQEDVKKNVCVKEKRDENRKKNENKRDEKMRERENTILYNI